VISRRHGQTSASVWRYMIQVRAIPVLTDSDPNERYANTFILLKRSRNDQAAGYRRPCQHTARHLLGLCSCPWFVIIWSMKLCILLVNSFPPSRRKLGVPVEITLGDIIVFLSQNCKKNGQYTYKTIL
jgi:hypothetical protein